MDNLKLEALGHDVVVDLDLVLEERVDSVSSFKLQVPIWRR